APHRHRRDRGRLGGRGAARPAVGGGAAGADLPAAAPDRLLRTPRETQPGAGPVGDAPPAARTGRPGGGRGGRRASAALHRRSRPPVGGGRPRPDGVPVGPVAAGRRAGRGAAGRHGGEGRHGRRVDGGAAVARPRRRRSADRDRGRRPHRPGAPHRDHRAGGERRHVNDEDATRRRAALRTLLRRPLLTAEADPEDLVLVRRYQAELRDWLSRETAWRLQVDAETARLFKTAPTLDDGTHPARGKAGEPFGRRRYVVLCLALAVLERAD